MTVENLMRGLEGLAGFAGVRLGSGASANGRDIWSLSHFCYLCSSSSSSAFKRRERPWRLSGPRRASFQREWAFIVTKPRMREGARRRTVRSLAASESPWSMGCRSRYPVRSGCVKWLSRQNDTRPMNLAKVAERYNSVHISLQRCSHLRKRLFKGFRP